MRPTKTLQERETELRTMLATPEGQKELDDLKIRYQAASDRLKPGNTSVITYILVHERDKGMIAR